MTEPLSLLYTHTHSSTLMTFALSLSQQAVVEGDLIRVEQGYKEPRSVKILFEECFFNSRDESYQVFCLEQPLEGALSDEIIVLLENLEDCIKFLWSEPGSEKVRRSVDRLLEIYQLERDALRPMMVRPLFLNLCWVYAVMVCLCVVLYNYRTLLVPCTPEQFKKCSNLYVDKFELCCEEALYGLFLVCLCAQKKFQAATQRSFLKLAIEVCSS